LCKKNQFFSNISVVIKIIRKIPIYYIIEEVITYKKCIYNIFRGINIYLDAFCGCDTTSSFYRKGKVQCFNIVEKRPYLLHSIETFYDPIASKDNICKAGEMFILALYNASEKETNLDNYRYQCFAKNVSSSKNVLLTIPPSEAAAREHSFRVYHQIQMWLGNEKIPVEWGWHLKSDLLLPTPLKGPLIPEILLNLISCNCTKGCTASCGCRKHGLKCSTICGYCKGNSCLNAMEAIDEDDIESISDEGNKSKKEADEINVTNRVYILNNY